MTSDVEEFRKFVEDAADIFPLKYYLQEAKDIVTKNKWDAAVIVLDELWKEAEKNYFLTAGERLSKGDGIKYNEYKLSKEIAKKYGYDTKGIDEAFNVGKMKTHKWNFENRRGCFEQEGFMDDFYSAKRHERYASNNFLERMAMRSKLIISLMKGAAHRIYHDLKQYN